MSRCGGGGKTCTSAPPANFPGQHLFSGRQSLQQAAPTARTAADSNSALSGDRSRDAFLLCLTVSLPTCQSRGPLYAPAASRKKKKRRKCGCWRTIYQQNRSRREESRCVATAEVRPLKTSCENQCWLPAIRVMESPLQLQQ